MSVATWSIELNGHRYELDVSGFWPVQLVLRVDSAQVAQKKVRDDRVTLRIDADRRVEVRLTALGSVRRATVHDKSLALDFDAPDGSRAARRQEWGLAHPVLYALRHVASAAFGVLVIVLGVSALLRGLFRPVREWIAEHTPDLPSIPLPSISLPRLPLPDIPAPDWDAPAWLVTFFDYDWLWKPLIFGLVLALWEIRRQRRQRELREGKSAAPEGAATTRTGIGTGIGATGATGAAEATQTADATVTAEATGTEVETTTAATAAQEDHR